MIVVLYLAAVVAAIVFSAVTGEVGTAWTVVVWSPWPGPPPGWSGNGFVPALIGSLRAWMLWQVLRGPVVRVPRPPQEREAVALRLALYLGVAVNLIPWSQGGGLYQEVASVVSLVVRVALVVLFALVLTGTLPGFRTVALALGVVGVAGAALGRVLVPTATSEGGLGPVPVWLVFEVLGLVRVAWQVMMLRGQRGDGRWSAATVRYGVLDLVAFLALLVVNAVNWRMWNPPIEALALGWVLAALNVFGPIWWARTAHELADDRRQRVVAGR
ncbi:hypothetical protein [Nonomuraea sp. NPDC050643]|uniref:hypothetical protein n=1 Tax=Nonomuraea sp. NPDC050643 TaxID=3155660 RepID=UPI0033DCA285